MKKEWRPLSPAKAESLASSKPAGAQRRQSLELRSSPHYTLSGLEGCSYTAQLLLRKTLSVCGKNTVPVPCAIAIALEPN